MARRPPRIWTVYSPLPNERRENQETRRVRTRTEERACSSTGTHRRTESQIVLVKSMKWVTRLYVHVDRTACPWLIKRFVDPKAEFLFVPVEKIEETAKKEKAIPYDASGVELGHHGDKCSFDAIIEKYKVQDPAVLELAKIVRAADTDKMEMAPEAAGMEAVMTGFGIVSKDDYETIAKASPVYDALYTNCKLRLIREKYKAEIEKLERKDRREFLKKKLAE